jgi:hypothetical protein
MVSKSASIRHFKGIPITSDNQTHVDEAILATSAVRQLVRPHETHIRPTKAYIESTRPIVEDEEPLLDDAEDLFSFRTEEEAFPSWLTEKLRIGNWTPLTHSLVSPSTLSSQSTVG